MNRRQLMIGTAATIGVMGARSMPTLAQEDLEAYEDQLLSPQEGAVSKAMRRFVGDDDMEFGYFVTVFEDNASAKAWWQLERDNSVALTNELDLTDHEIEATLVEVDDEEKFGKDTFMIKRPVDQIFYPVGLTTIHAYNRNVHVLIEVQGIETEDALAFAKENATFKIEDAKNEDDLLALIPTEEKVKDEFDDSLSLDHEAVSFVVDGKWENQ